MNLYSKLVPAGKLIVVVHKGLDEVYFEAESAGAFAVFQLPSWEMDPASLIVWPTTVVVFELNVTATVATGVAHPVATALEVALVEVGATDDTLLVVGGLEPEDPVIRMSAQVRYTCGVWKEFHLNDSSVWFDT